MTDVPALAEFRVGAVDADRTETGTPDVGQLTVKIHSEQGSFWAEVVELPGCFASGADLCELLEATGEALRLYLDVSDEAATPVTMEALYSLPEGTVLYKPDLDGWTLFIRDDGYWRVVDAYNRARRGERWSPEAVGCYSPGYVVHQLPELGYYEPPAGLTQPPKEQQ